MDVPPAACPESEEPRDTVHLLDDQVVVAGSSSGAARGRGAGWGALSFPDPGHPTPPQRHVVTSSTLWVSTEASLPGMSGAVALAAGS